MNNSILVGHIKRVVPLAGEVFRVWIDFDAPPSSLHRAGQYLLIEVSDGNWSAFSIANAEAGKYHLELHMRPAEGDKGDELRSLIHSQQPIRIQYPCGDCVLVSDDEPLLLIVGGTGFSQAKAIIEDYLQRSISGHVSLLWLAADQSGLYMLDWLTETCAKYSQLTAHSLILDHSQMSHEQYIAAVLEQVQQISVDVESSWAFLAGSPPMVRMLIEPLTRLAIKIDKIRSDVIDLKL